MLYYGHVLPVSLREEMPFSGRLLCGIVCFFDSNDYQLIVAILANLKCGIIQQKGRTDESQATGLLSICFFPFHCASRTPRPFPFIQMPG